MNEEEIETLLSAIKDIEEEYGDTRRVIIDKLKLITIKYRPQRIKKIQNHTSLADWLSGFEQ